MNRRFLGWWPVLLVVRKASSLSTTVRLDKFLVETGCVGSRKASAALVRSGRVEVDGVVVKIGKSHIEKASVVQVDGEVVVSDLPLLCLYHKPLGVHSTMNDVRGRPDLSTASPWKMHPVGRLDQDTSGLLLFSSRGDLTHRLLHPKRRVEKEYLADCRTSSDHVDDMKRKLAAGVSTSTGVHTADLVDAVCLADDLLRLRIVVTEGKHRMVRRILANIGAPVVALHRHRFGPIRLGDLPPGDIAPIADPDLLNWATALLGGETITSSSEGLVTEG